MRTVHHTYRRKVKIPKESGDKPDSSLVAPDTPVKLPSNETKNQSLPPACKNVEVKPAGQLTSGLGLKRPGLETKPVPAVRDADVTETIKQELGIAYTRKFRKVRHGTSVYSRSKTVS